MMAGDRSHSRPEDETPTAAATDSAPAGKGNDGRSTVNGPAAVEPATTESKPVQPAQAESPPAEGETAESELARIGSAGSVSAGSGSAERGSGGSQSVGDSAGSGSAERGRAAGERAEAEPAKGEPVGSDADVAAAESGTEVTAAPAAPGMDTAEATTVRAESSEDDHESHALPAVAAEPEPDDKRHTPWAQVLGWSRSPAALLVGVLIGLLGFGLAVQVRSNTSTSGLPAARQEDLVRILDDLSSREDRLRRQIAELEAARTRLSTTGNSSSTALEEARKRSDALGVLAGSVPAQGPGIRLTLTDPEHRLAAEDLLDTVEELRAAGAEAIQVGGVRIGLDSSFTSTDRGLVVDGVAVTAPYQIVAIGDPATLATAMEIPGGVADTAQRAGGAARTEQAERVVIRALRAVRTPRYAQPTN